MTGDGLVIGTAGHIDHGKTTLVGALTGRDTDRLAQEKARGISIELGFAPLRLPSGRRLGLIDVPGHERFVRHMVAGASGVDAFLLCVAADDGVMPQTREHLAVLDLLGVRDGVVAITRADLASPAAATAAIRELVDEGVEVVPVCAPDGHGLDELIGALERVCLRVARRRASGPARLFVDRAFSAAGAGTVVTGTLWGAALERGDRVVVSPSGARGHVRALQVHDREVPVAAAGRVAVNIAGVERTSAMRGSCVVRAEDGWRSTDLLDVALTWLDDAPAPLRTRRQLRAFLGTAELTATCILLEDGALDPGERGYAQLRLEGRVVAAPGDRLILRSAERRTVGGARVVDAAPARHGRGAGAADRLRVIDHGDPAAIAALRLAEAGAAGLPAGAPGIELTDAIVLGEVALAPEVLARARAAVLAAVEGGPLGLAAARAASGLGPDPAAALVEMLARQGAIARLGTRVGPVGVEEAVPGAEELATILAQAGMRPPAEGELARLAGLSPAGVRAGLAALRRGGRALPGGDLWFDAGAVARARGMAEAAILARGPMTLGELRDLWGIGRRPALGLVALLDAAGVTRRVGDRRVLVGTPREPPAH